MSIRRRVLLLTPPLLAATALISSLSAPEYGQFSYPYRAQIQPLFEQWRNQAPTNAPGHPPDCKTTPNPKAKPISAQGWAWLKQQKLADLKPETLVQAFGNPLCLAEINGKQVARYLSGFSDAQIEIVIGKTGLTYELRTPSAGMATQPRQVVGTPTAPPAQPSDR